MERRRHALLSFLSSDRYHRGVSYQKVTSMLNLDCPRCGRLLKEDERTCPDCGFETGSLHWRLTRTAKRRFVPAQEEFQSLYLQLGGKDVLEHAVDSFYDRVLADSRIKHFFDRIDTKCLRDNQRDFLSYACGGPVTYDSDKLREAHRHLDLKDEHFDAVVEHLKTTLEEIGQRNAR